MSDRITSELAEEFLEQASRYFHNRPTGGEDMAHWSNVTNSENCRSIADLIRYQADLMRKAHAVMRECGWQLAIGAEPQSDGILEAACTEIEADFSEHLYGNKGQRVDNN